MHPVSTESTFFVVYYFLYRTSLLQVSKTFFNICKERWKNEADN